MKTFSVRTALFVVATLFITLLAGNGKRTAVSAQTVASQSPAPQAQVFEDRWVTLRAGTSPNIPEFVPPPDVFLRPSRVKTATINVNYIGSWDSQAQTAFQYAVDIWETLVNSPVTIEIEAEWASLGSGILGGAGAGLYLRDFPNAPVSATWYPIGLANSLAGFDLSAGNPDIFSAFNKDFTGWYFGTDGFPPLNKYDFVSVVLHEIGHGLGFAGSMGYSNGLGYWGKTNDGVTFDPTIYDRFSENGSGQSLINTALFGNPSTALGNQITSGNVFFDGPNAKGANNCTRPKLYAPGSWQQGSSYSHLDEATYSPGTINSLMTPIINNGEANHDPGPVAMGIYADSGWSINADINNEPVISGLPNQTAAMDIGTDNAIDLWAYSSDCETPDNNLSFSVFSTTNANAGVSIDGDRYIDINPTAGWEGTATITIQVTDSGGKTSTDSFQVTVENTPPEFSGSPMFLVEKDTTNNQVIDLRDFASDLQTSDNNLTFNLVDAGDANANVTLTGNWYINVNPASGWFGTTSITIEALDAQGLASDPDLTIPVVVAEQIFDVSLPVILRN